LEKFRDGICEEYDRVVGKILELLNNIFEINIYRIEIVRSFNVLCNTISNRIWRFCWRSMHYYIVVAVIFRVFPYGIIHFISFLLDGNSLFLVVAHEILLVIEWFLCSAVS
jgi:hypothetical protein